MRLPYSLICIDLETTDLNSEFGSLIELGAIFLSEDLKQLDTFQSYVKPLTSFRNTNAMNVNRISEDILETAPLLPEVLEQFEQFAFCKKTKKDIVLAAWGNYFDIPFLSHQYRKIYREYPFSHKSIDLKSIAIWEFAKRDIPVKGGIYSFLKYLSTDFEGVEHSALDDITNSIRILDRLRTYDERRHGW